MENVGQLTDKYSTAANSNATTSLQGKLFIFVLISYQTLRIGHCLTHYSVVIISTSICIVCKKQKNRVTYKQISHLRIV